MSEMIDFFDSKMNYLGVATRDEVHEKGLWHKTFHCWFVTKKNNETFVLLQLRGSQKKSYPNCLDITAAGHLASKEKIEDGIREIKEELGIDVNFADLTFLGVRVGSSESQKVTNKEFNYVYMYNSPYSLEDYQLQEDEVDGIVQVTVADGLKLFTGEVDKVCAYGYVVENGEKVEIQRQIRRMDLIPRVDNYYLKVFIMADLYFKKYQYLSI